MRLSKVFRAPEREPVELSAKSNQDFLIVCSVQRGVGLGESGMRS